MSEPTDKPFLYVVVCAAGIAADVGTLITAARRRGWEVGVIATPQGLGFFDVAAAEELTGRPIRSAWRAPGDPRPFPAPDAVALAPASPSTPSTSGRRAYPTPSPSEHCARHTDLASRSPYCPV